MFKLAKPVFFICETPLHAGSGSELGVVDLPIQRERHTDFPKIESSSLKGGLREAFEEPTTFEPFTIGKEKETVTPTSKVKAADNDPYQSALNLVFGPENAGNDAHAGALGFTDARLLLFPVKSMKGVFAWITCPKALQQLQNDLKLCKIQVNWSVPDDAIVPKDCQLFITEKKDKLVLEEYTFTFDPTANTAAQENCANLVKWLSEYLFPVALQGQADPYAYWRKKMQTDVVVLTNDDFRDFVMLSTEVITRTRIDNATGTVARGALFTEEYLPAESMLYSLALASPIFHDNKGIFKQNGTSEETVVMEFFKGGLPDVIQLGGNATIGKGIVRTHLMEA